MRLLPLLAPPPLAPLLTYTQHNATQHTMHPTSASIPVPVPASQPFPITQVPTHNNNSSSGDSDSDLDDDDGGDSGLFSSLQCAVSSFSSWGTETDSGAESDPFCFDDETSQAIIRAPSVKEQVVVVVEVDVAVSVDVGVGTMVVVVQRRRSLLKRWVVAVWGVVARVFRRRGRAGTGAGMGDKAGKQS